MAAAGLPVWYITMKWLCADAGYGNYGRDQFMQLERGHKGLLKKIEQIGYFYFRLE